MEKEASRRSGRSISDKKSSNSDDDVGSTKLHSAVEEFPSKIRVMGRRFDGGGGGGGGGRGPTGSNSGGVNEVVGHMYFDSVSTSRLAAENFSTNSQLFDIFAAPHSTTTTTPFKSPVMAEGLMATSIAFPFTSAQWRELERQAMIYKYMISSIPVPPDLLFPLSRNFPPSAVDSSLSSMYSVRYSKNGDPEPGRCKRTDGKKWRCSKDVAPHQKYCERHLHRGRPRSRKPVEDKNVNGENNKRTRIEQTNNLPNSTAAPNEKPLLLFNPKSDLNLSNTPSSTRDLSLMMDTEQKWQRLIETNMGFSNEGCSIYDSAASLFHQDYVDQSPLNMLSYSSYPPSEIVPPFSFIDAWSIENGNVETTGPKEPENFSPSLNLSIAMASGSISDQEMAGVHNCCGDDRDSKCHDAVYWEPFALGGPLAEALPAWGCKNPASPHDSISTVATTVSSPTGVLHRTLFSHSDGSVCNSPTFPAPISEVAFRWLN